MANYNRNLLDRDYFGDLMTVAEYLECVECGAFIDYDGFGYAVKDGMVDEETFMYPSQRHELPEDATHILWFNR